MEFIKLTTKAIRELHNEQGGYEDISTSIGKDTDNGYGYDSTYWLEYGKRQGRGYVFNIYENSKIAKENGRVPKMIFWGNASEFKEFCKVEKLTRLFL